MMNIKNCTVMMSVLLILLFQVSFSITEGDEYTWKYHTYSEMESLLFSWEANNSEIMDVFVLGRTYEGRYIYCVKISDNVEDDEENEANILYMGLHHAREFMSSEVPLYIINYIIEHKNDTHIKNIIENAQLWLIPMLNPDGHVYVEKGNDWRKNRRPIDIDGDGVIDGVGVDLNRNYGYRWGQEASHVIDDEDYCGPYPFSENETQCVKNLVENHTPVISISYHTFGSYILHPWGNSYDDNNTLDPMLHEIAVNMSLLMPEIRRYTPMSARDMYPATGDSDDYLWSTFGTFAYTIELGNSHHPDEETLTQICQDNLPVALYAAEKGIEIMSSKGEHTIVIQGPQLFRVDPGVTIEGSFRIYNKGDFEEEISLSVQSTCTWTYSVQPNKIKIEKGEMEVVKIIISVPPKALAETTEHFILTASNEKISKNVTFSVVVNQIHSFDINISLPTSGYPDEIVMGNISVKNGGNGDEVFVISAWADGCCTVYPIPNTLKVQMDDVGKVPLKLKIGKNAIGNEVIYVHVSAVSEDGKMKKEDVANITVNEVHSLKILLERDYYTTYENKEIRINFTVSNEGNVDEVISIGIHGNGSEYTHLNEKIVEIEKFSHENCSFTFNGSKGIYFLMLKISTKKNVIDELPIEIEVKEVKEKAKVGRTYFEYFILVIVIVWMIFMIRWLWKM